MKRVLFAEAGYMSAFGGIRDLAVELRQALQAKDKNAFKTVYSWQYICKLEVGGIRCDAVHSRMAINSVSETQKSRLLSTYP